MKWLGLILFFAGSLCAEDFSFQQGLMGTMFRIKLHADSKENAEMAADAAFRRIVELDAIFSDYSADSEVMRLIASPVGEPVKVSRELFNAVELARELSEKSGGIFDITMGPHVRNWRMARRTGKLPSAEEIAVARAATGMDKLKANEKTRTLTLTVPNMRLDFGGMAKGLAADEALAVLKNLGFPQTIVAAGGDLAIGAAPTYQEGWTVEILAADEKKRTRILQNAGVSTSGDREQFIEIDGQRYSHIVDPRTGLGVRHSNSVTVIAPNTSLSDPLATALSVLSERDGLALCAKFDQKITVIRAKAKEE